MEDPRYVEIDERWIPEWVHAGMAEIDHLLERHAAYEQWCRAHGRIAEPDMYSGASERELAGPERPPRLRR